MFGIFKKVNRLEQRLKDLELKLWDVKTPFLFKVGDAVELIDGTTGLVCGVDKVRCYSGILYDAYNTYQVLVNDTVYVIPEFNLTKVTKKSRKSP